MGAIVFIAAAFLAQDAPPPAEEPRLPQEIRLRGGRLVYGFVDEQRSDDKKLCVWPDTPWAPPKFPEYYDTSELLREPRPEEPRHHEERIKEGFEGMDLRLVGSQYWVPQNWVPEGEYEFARRAWEMAARLESTADGAASSAPMGSSVAEAASAPDGAPANTPGPMQGRGPQLALGAATLLLAALIVRFLLL